MSLSEPDPIDLREVEYYRGKAYEVLFYGEKIGVVRHCFPSFERGPRQATYVTKRWQAKKPYWEYVELGKNSPCAMSYETRKRAVEQLVRRAAQAIEARRAATVEQGAVEDESAVAESDAPTISPSSPSIELDQ